MAYAKGQTVTSTKAYKTYQAPAQNGLVGGGKTYDMAAGSGGVIKDVRGDWVDVDYTANGGGTGWVHISAFEPVAQPKPTQPQQVQPYLGAMQQNLAGNLAGMQAPTVQSTSELIQQYKDLLPAAGERPDRPNLVQSYQEMAEQFGLTGLQEELNQLKAQEDEIVAQRRIRQQANRNDPVAMDVIQGRASEIDYQEMERIDFVQRQKARKVDEINMAMGTVTLMMDLTQKDYANAVADFDSRFSQALQTINLFQTIQRDQRDEYWKYVQNAQAVAKVNLDLIREGGLDYSRLSPDQKLQLDQVAIAAGFGAGFFATVRPDPKANLLANVAMSDGRVQLIYANPDGTIRTEIQGVADPYKVQQMELERRQTEAQIAASQASTAASYASANRQAQEAKTNERASTMAYAANTLISRVISTQDKYVDKNEFDREVKRLMQDGWNQEDARLIIFKAFDTGKLQEYPKGARF